MSLYDDYDVKTQSTEKVSGWSSGIKLLQSQLQLKKATVTQPKRDQQRKASLAPVIDLKSKRDEDEIFSNTVTIRGSSRVKNEHSLPIIPSLTGFGSEYDWNVDNEYDPLWPNEYEKVVKELRDQRDRENEKEERRREKKRKSRFSDPEEDTPTPMPSQATPQVSLPPVGSGFAGRWEEDEEPVTKSSRVGGGVAIAPPPSLQEPPEAPIVIKPTLVNTYDGSSVAAKIMAKYGFKEGQGLGKQEQGMSMALQVEKTSKRGGRIIHEKEIMPPPVTDFGAKQELSITEMMKSPSKVVVLRNMVGPGEVDDELEPEVKDECNTKYGEVGSVIIHEFMDKEPEEAVRIFVEFKRIESAIKAVVDLNGRFFGGRQVRACFYDADKFDNLQLDIDL
ncbi:splicing factor 45 [Agrilus planipennis]|uniref:Splicing factor 45 n=1 Tax=Agrilus planipennis TaxID=224129 RepID=A0A1W4WGA0_AGRPL|nr:splicing factor 45 [Agrilus planipennis]